MKKNINSVDEFFRDSLQDHKVTPSEAARSRFLDEAAATGSSGRSNFLRWYNILAVAVVITAPVILYYHFSQDNAPAPEKFAMQPITGITNNSAPEHKASIPEKPDNKVNTDSNTPGTDIETTKKKSKNQTVKNSHANGPIHSENAKAESSSDKRKLAETIDPVVVLENKATASESLNIETKKRIDEPVRTLETPEPGSDVNTQLSDTVTVEKNMADIPPLINEPQPQPSPQPIKPPFGFTPYVLYSLDWNPGSKGNSLAHSLGVEGKIQYRKFSLTAGTGVTSTKGHSNYEVQYNDYLGNYQKLDSITFAWDQKQYNLEPTYYLSDTKVWDTAVKLDSYQEEMRYNQLRIPVMLGYDILSGGRFVFGIKTGVEMVFYLKSRNLTEYEYSAGQNKLVSVNSLTDELARNNFWFMANISAAYNITRRIVFEVEPRVQYLLNPDKTAASQSNQEVSPALRTSLKIKF